MHACSLHKLHREVLLKEWDQLLVSLRFPCSRASVSNRGYKASEQWAMEQLKYSSNINTSLVLLSLNAVKSSQQWSNMFRLSLKRLLMQEIHNKLIIYTLNSEEILNEQGCKSIYLVEMQKQKSTCVEQNIKLHTLQEWQLQVLNNCSQVLFCFKDLCGHL